MERCDPFEAAHAVCRSRSPAVPAAGRPPRPPRLRGSPPPFTVKLQGREVPFVFDGAEGAQAHMQGDPGQLDAPIGEGLQQGIAEMGGPAVGAATAPGLLA